MPEPLVIEVAFSEQAKLVEFDEADSETVPLKPFSDDTAITEKPDTFGLEDTTVGLAEIAKSGIATVAVTFSRMVLTLVPNVALIWAWYSVVTVGDAVNITAAVEVCPADSVIAFDTSVTVRGGVAGATAPFESVIVPTKPFRLDKVSVLEALDPDGNEM